VNHISNEKKQTVLDCVTICANPMTWNTVITHMYAKNIPVKVKRWKQTERQTNNNDNNNDRLTAFDPGQPG